MPETLIEHDTNRVFPGGDCPRTDADGDPCLRPDPHRGNWNDWHSYRAMPTRPEDMPLDERRDLGFEEASPPHWMGRN